MKKTPQKSAKRRWWQESYVTLMVIPEKTRRVHKLILPFFVLKLAVVSVSIAMVFLIMVGIDYVHVMGMIAENKSLKGENSKLRDQLFVVQNKVDTMEYTLTRVRNYAKKLQVLTGQEDKKGNVGQEKLRGSLFDESLEKGREDAADEKKKVAKSLSGNLLAESKLEGPLTTNYYEPVWKSFNSLAKTQN